MVECAHHNARVGLRPDEPEPSAEHHPFEPGAEEGHAGSHGHEVRVGGALVHWPSMTGAGDNHQGRNTPIDAPRSRTGLGASVDRSASPASAEAMFVRVFLLLRAYHVAAGALTLMFDRRRLERPRLAWLVFAGLIGESAWLARRVTRRGDYADAPTATIDVGAVALGLVACAIALPADEQFNATNWMYPVSLMSGVGAASAFASRRDGLAATAVLGGSFAAMATIRSQRRTVAALLGLAQYFECFAAGDLLTRQVRRTAAEIDRLRGEAVEVAQQRGRDGARARLQGELHAGALEALEAVHRHLVAGASGQAAAVARLESARLRRALRGEPDRIDVTFRSRIESVVDGYADAPFRVELVDDGAESEPDAAAAEALYGAVAAVLACASVAGSGSGSGSDPGDESAEKADSVRRATGAGRIVIAISAEDEATEVTVRLGCGDRLADTDVALLVAGMAKAGGSAAIERGSTGACLVTLRVGP